MENISLDRGVESTNPKLLEREVTQLTVQVSTAKDITQQQMENS
jgi:hypothetical protein